MSPRRTLPSISQILNLLVSFLIPALAKGIIRLPSTGSSRVDSHESQRIIGDALRAFTAGHPLFVEHGLSLEHAPSNTHWYDFLIRSECGQIWIPINLKVSNCKGRDDVKAKEGLFYAVTGMSPDGKCTRHWDAYCKHLAANIAWTNCLADYIYLIVEKSPRDPDQSVFWTSIMRLNAVHPSGANPPFQSHWPENRNHSERSRQEAILYLLGNLRESLKLRAAAYESYQRHMDAMLAELEAGESLLIVDEPEDD